MATKKITELPTANSVANTDLLLTVTSPSGPAATKKITVQNFFSNVSFGTVAVNNTATVSGNVVIGGSLTSNTVTANQIKTGNTVANVTITDTSIIVANEAETDSALIGARVANTTTVRGITLSQSSSESRLEITSTGAAATPLNVFIGGTNRMQIAANGNIGIGNTAPSAKLQVTGNTNVTGNLTVSADSTFQANLRINGTLTTNNVIIPTRSTPANSTALTIQAGSVFFDSNFIYVATSDNIVKRAPLSTF